MTEPRSAHLSEEALNDVLIGLGTPEAELHLARCEACRGQLEAFRSGLRVFNQATLTWSEARPAKTFRVARPAPARHMLFASVEWALGAVILLMIGLPVWNHNHRVYHKSGAVPAVETEVSEAQIAEDNQLLLSVNEVLSEKEISPLSEYRLLKGPRLHRKARPELRNR